MDSQLNAKSLKIVPPPICNREFKLDGDNIYRILHIRDEAAEAGLQTDYTTDDDEDEIGQVL